MATPNKDDEPATDEYLEGLVDGVKLGAEIIIGSFGYGQDVLDTALAHLPSAEELAKLANAIDIT